jgi:predicted TIM-barrel fold metal-dependent hydrolase
MTTIDVDKLLLPDPSPEVVTATVISVDDHVLEAPDTFIGRLPAKFVERGPRVVETEDGQQAWEFDGQRYSEPGDLAVAGRDKRLVLDAPFRFEYMRPGFYQPEARLQDMDVSGIWASMMFPSFLSGFCGRIFAECSDPELGKAVTMAWNDWINDVWAEPYPDRFIPLGITFLTDPEFAAAEIRRNAARGFKAVSLPDRPHKLGLPSIFEDYWDPILRACAETETVVGLHVGSTGLQDTAETTLALYNATTSILFGQISIQAATEWLVSGYPSRYPDLKIAMSEGGIGWVGMLMDRADKTAIHTPYVGWWMEDILPSEALLRSFWFCTIDDPSTIDHRDVIGIENILAEVDYPHGDSTWPHTQELIRKNWGHLPAADLRAICSENAAKLFRHPLPSTVLPEG